MGNITMFKISASALILIILLSILYIWIANSPDDARKFIIPCIPSSYKIVIAFDMNSNKSYGETSIKIDVISPFTQLPIHAAGLMIDQVHIICVTSGDVFNPISATFKDNVSKMLIFQFNDEIPMGNYLLNLTYTGIINPQYMHFKYNEPREIIIKSSPSNILFPCWDQSHFKANFTITVKHSNNFTAVSNSHSVAINNISDNHYQTSFAETPKMSVNDVVFILAGSFRCKDTSNTIVVICGHYVSYDNLKIIEDAANNIAALMEEYTAIPYNSSGFEKLQILIFDNHSQSQVATHGVFSLEESIVLTEWLVHGIVYTWFATFDRPDLSHMWITSGLPIFFGNLILSQMDYQTNPLGFHVLDRIRNAKQEDTSFTNFNSAHLRFINKKKIYRDAYTRYNIEHFKCAARARMFFHLFKVADLQKAVHNYLSVKIVESNVTTNLIDQVKNITGVEDQHLEQVAINWFTNPGFPYLNVTRNYTSGKVIITQSPFIVEISNNIKQLGALYNLYTYIGKPTFQFVTQSNMKTIKYWVPINYATGHDSNFENTTITHWSTPTNESLEISVHGDTWLILNKLQFGYYCVNYDQKNWEMIIAALKSSDYKRIHVWNRVQIIDDAFNFLIVGQFNYTLIFSLLEYLQQEVEIEPWLVTQSHMESKLLILRKHFKYSKRFTAWMAKITENMAKSMDFYSLLKADFRSVKNKLAYDLMIFFCAMGSSTCLKNATDTFYQCHESEKTQSLCPQINFQEDLMELLCIAGINVNRTTWLIWLKAWNISKEYKFLPLVLCGLPRNDIPPIGAEIINSKIPFDPFLKILKLFFYYNVELDENTLLNLFFNHIEDLIITYGEHNSVFIFELFCDKLTMSSKKNTTTELIKYIKKFDDKEFTEMFESYVNQSKLQVDGNRPEFEQFT